ncbi:30S ribosomal protein S4e [Candidatus Tiddalikarchaeum anstoanum]|nr:30S ribosomal protein S4e [Candidatus Tiddalikarchaeum anstoanum]
MHLKRLNTPKRWNIAKKTEVFIAKPLPGPHSKESSIPLIVLLKDHLKLISTRKECKGLLLSKKILVDNLPVSDPNFPVGLFDVISVPDYNMYYRILFDYKGWLITKSIDKKEAQIKPYKIVQKTRIKGKKLQINCTSGKNLLTAEKNYKVGDTLLVDLSTKKIVKHLPLKEGSFVFVSDGTHAGETATVTGFREFKGGMPDRVMLKNDKGLKYETAQDYAFVVGEKNSEILLGEKK